MTKRHSFERRMGTVMFAAVIAGLFLISALFLQYGAAFTPYSNTIENTYVNGKVSSPFWYYTNPSPTGIIPSASCGVSCVSAAVTAGSGNFTFPKVFSSAGTSSQQVSAVPLTYGLEGYWAFDEGSGTSAYDLSGNGNTGTLVNSPAWVAGKYGEAINFSASGEEATFGSLDIAANAPISAAAWVYLYAYPSSGDSAAVRIDWSNVALGMVIMPSGFYNVYYQCGAGCGQLNSSVKIPLKSWTFLSATFTGGSSSNTKCAFVNGVEASCNEEYHSDTSTKTSTFTIGDTRFNEQLFGSEDNLGVWSTNMSASEIQELYQSTFPVLTHEFSSGSNTWNTKYYYQIPENLSTYSTYTSLGQNLTSGTVAGIYWVDQGYSAQPLDAITVFLMLGALLVFIFAGIAAKTWVLGIFAFVMGAYFLSYMYRFTSVALETTLIQSTGNYAYNTTSIEPFLMITFCLMLISILSSLRLKRLI